MADKEMRIKVSVDNNQYVKAMRDMGKVQDGVTSKLSQSAGMLSSTNGAVAKSQKGILGMGKAWVSANTGLGTFTAGLTPMTAAISLGSKAIGAAGKFAIDASKDYAAFEGTLKQVQIVAGGTQADMDMLGEKAIEIGGKTSKGAQEVAEAMVEFAKLGFTAEETAAAMEGIVYAAEASGSAVDTTAQIVAAGLNTWNLAASDSEHIADVLAKTANETAADMTDLGYTFQYAGASAQLGGASIEQLAAYTGLMADQGIKGSKAGTALRTAFTNLTSPTDNAAAALEALNINLKDAEGNARPIPDVIGDLQDAVQGMSDSEILDLSTKLFGKTGAAGMSAVLKATRDETNDLTAALVNSTGTAAKQAAEMRQTMEGQLDQLGDSWDAIKLKIGKGIQGTIGLEGVKAANDALDMISEGIDKFMDKAKESENVEKIWGKMNDRISESGKSLDLGTSELGKFAAAVAELDENARSIQTADPFANLFGSDAQESIELVSNKFTELEIQAASFSFISQDKLNELTTATATVMDTLSQTSALVAVENAKYRADPKYNPTAAISTAIQEGLPNLQSALETQLGLVKENNNNQLSALTTFLNNSNSIDDEAKAAALAAQQTHNSNQEASISQNNARILELYQNLGNQSLAEREASLKQIENLTRANAQQVLDISQAQSDAVIIALEAQASATGTITGEQKQAAIGNANEQRDKTVQAAMEQYTESVKAINMMSDESVAKTGKTREQLIAEARKQTTETVAQAEKMRDETVKKIQAIADKASETKPTVEVKATASGFSGVLGQIAALRQAAAAGATVNVSASGSGIGKVGGGNKARGGIVTSGGTRKASGGLVDGSGYGMGSGKATYDANMTAVGIGNQLGQGGISQGVTHNERGREVIMPVQNSTYMAPFARAVAQELTRINSSSQPILVEVPLYIDGKQLTKQTRKYMTDAQDSHALVINKINGK
jgi:TP901 family phage tail tape measure protein